MCYIAYYIAYVTQDWIFFKCYGNGYRDLTQ